MISVVVPIYNVEQYIVKTIESIVNQSYTDFELILVDDGSKDDSITVAEKYLADKDIKYHVLRNKNSGVSHARNKGIKSAKGDYIVFVDSDDYLHRDFLAVLYSLMNEDTDLTFCDFQFIKNQSQFECEDSYNRSYTKDELLQVFLRREIGFVVPSMMFKRSFLIDNNLYFNEEVRFSEDQMYIWDVFFACTKAGYSSRKLYGYCIRDNSTMTSSSYDKIKDANEEYGKYTKDLQVRYPDYSDITTLILPRWQLGCLYTAANILKKDEFRELYNQMDGKSILKRIKGIKERNAYLLAFVCSISDNLLYSLCRKLKLNG